MQPVLWDFGDAGEDIGEPGERINVVQPTGADEAKHHRGALSTPIRTDEQPCFPAPSHAAQRPLGGIVCKTDPAIFQECSEAFPVIEEVGDGLGYGIVP